MLPKYVNVAALDAVSEPRVASCYLMLTGEMPYSFYSQRASKIPARPAKHTRQTYIHEAFPVLLYQTRYGVICFAPFQQLAHSPVTLFVAPPHLSAGHEWKKDAQLRPTRRCRCTYFDARFDKSSPGIGREAEASRPTQVPSAAALISFDLDVPAKSSRSGDILRPITRTLPAKNSRKRFLWISGAEVRRFTFGRVLQRPPWE
jgi:hypothetical protein